MLLFPFIAKFFDYSLASLKGLFYHSEPFDYVQGKPNEVA